MLSRELLLTIWFFISPIIILYLYLKLKGMRNFGEGMLEKLQECWDLEYKNIVLNYGSTKNFLDLLTMDFKEVRENGVNYLSMFKATLEKIEKLTDVKSTITKAELIEIMNEINSITSFSNERSEEFLNYLIKDEELHGFETSVEKRYNEIKAKEFDNFTMGVIKKDSNKDN